MVYSIEYLLDKHFPVVGIIEIFSILENYDIDYSKVGRLDISEFAFSLGKYKNGDVKYKGKGVSNEDDKDLF